MIHDQLTHRIIDDLAEKSWSVSNNYFEPDFLEKLIAEEKAMWEEGSFRKARVGAGDQKQLRPEIRSDHVLWLEEDDLTDLQQEYWNRILQLRNDINKELYLGLNGYEAHFAVFPPNSFYKKHLDQFAAVKERTISCILYHCCPVKM